MTDKVREEFEAAFVQRQVDLFGEGYRDSAIHLLKRKGDFDKPPTHYELQRREQGLYDLHWVEMTYWAWQASRESLVVDLSDLSQCFSPNDCGDWAIWLDDAKKLIEAAGLKVKP